jgi:demethylmenaquinone methyltransferase/2-methoxy-6-polyprenyl-1,4-benzoquinol methylase
MLFGPPPPTDFGTGQMFDQISTRYDMINRVLALRMDISWRQQMTKQIHTMLSADGGRGGGGGDEELMILDMATGTADVAIQLAKEFPSTKTTILGLDPSENMLAVGRQKVSHQRLADRITLEHADARDLSKYPSNTFDVATMAFGIRNVPSESRDKALCEIHRLLKTNKGVLGVLEFSEPDTDKHGILGVMAQYFIRYVVPIVGGVLSGKPKEYMHLQNSIKEFPTPDEFHKLLGTLNCGNGGGHFVMEEVQHLNFGSVQLYIGRAVSSSSSNEEGTEKERINKTRDPVLPPIRSATRTNDDDNEEAETIIDKNAQTSSD